MSKAVSVSAGGRRHSWAEATSAEHRKQLHSSGHLLKDPDASWESPTQHTQQLGRLALDLHLKHTPAKTL